MAVASQTLFLQNPTLLSPLVTSGIAFAFFSSRCPKTQYQFSRKPNVFLQKSNFYKPNNLALQNTKLYCKNPSKSNILACWPSKINLSPSQLTESTRHDLTELTRPDLTESTRSVSIVLATTILVSKLFGHALSKYVQGVCKIPSLNQLLTIQDNLMSTTRPLFFAAVRVHRQQLHTPWNVMASGIAKCIEVYMAVLAIRCALAYFPSVEWNRQPYSGLRDMCDPFLLFFRNIVPPLSETLDISASVGFLVLGVLLEILTTSR